MKRILLFLSMLYFTLGTFAQRDSVTHSCDFSSGQQNMWGPSFSPFTINQTIDIFSFPWNVSGGTGNSGIFTILGQSFGAAANFSTSGVIGSSFTLEGFTTGHVEVDYPVDITIDKPIDSTFNQGQTVLLKTDYTVSDSFALDTWYPSAGTAKLDLYFQLAASADITLCAFGCFTIPIIPSFSTPTMTLNLFTINAAGVYYLGPACAEAIPYYSFNNGPGQVGEPASGQNIFPFALPPAEDGCTTIPWMVHEDIMPLNLDDYCAQCGDFGIGGQLTIPYVETDDTLDAVTNFLAATGDSMYVEFSLEIFKLLGGILGVIDPAPPAIEVASQVLSNLSNEFTLPAPFGTMYGATLSYNIMSASFVLDITNKQRFDFKPKIYGKFEFPVPVYYSILDASGAFITSGTGAIINIEIGQQIEYQFPCYFEEISIKPTYTIIGDFTNHTYDSLGFRFDFSALQFGFNLPGFNIIPAIHIPSFCFDLPYPCPTWSNPFRWCTTEVCTPEINIPAVAFPGFSFNIGPLIDESFPIADAQWDWFNQTWQLGGFQPCTHPAFKMKARLFYASANHTDVACKGENTGNINVTTFNGTAPLSYAWTNGATAQNLSGLTANDYLVTITDVNGCKTYTGATISEPATALSVDGISSDKLCFGGVDDGSITITPQGGTPSYTYAWSNGATTQNVVGLAAGSYQVVVQDSLGCKDSLTKVIAVPTQLIQSGIITNVSCFGGSNGAVAATGLGGYAPYTYAWSNMATTDNISNLSAGSYQLIVTDLNGCTHTASYVVAQPATYPNVSFSTIPVSCKGGNDGSIDLTPNGGTPGYNYQWFNASNSVMPITVQDLANIPSGSYTVQVTDANGCSISGSVDVAEPAASIDDNPVLTNILCFGQNTGAISSGITGGTAPYTYAWSNSATTPNITAVTAGTYTLTVNDSKGCSASYSYTLTQPNAALAINLTPTPVKCFGELTGQMTSVVSGGTAPYNYAWNTGSTSPSIIGVAAGTYNLTITDAHGCNLSNNATILQPLAPLSTSHTHTDVNCYSGNNGTINLTTVGGTTPYTYEWWNSTNQIMTNTTEDLSNMPASTYFVHVYDGNNCQKLDTITITQPTAPIAISAIMDDVNCFGAADGALNATVSGGTIPYNYAWSSGQTSEDLTGIVAGSYTLTVTDQNGCAKAATFDVTQPLTALNTIITNTAVLCNGGTDGGAQAYASGGTAPYSYAWSNGASTAGINFVPAGVYTLTTTDSKGCFSFAGTTIQQPPAPLSAIVNVTDASCYNYSDGSVQLNVSGGTQPYAFVWSNNVEVVLNNPSETLNNLSANNYLVRIRDKNNCEWEQIITVGQPAPFIAQASSTSNLCYGDSTGSIQLVVNGGTTPYTYLWSDGQTTQNAVNIPSGNYSVSITDAQGCIVRDTVFVSQPLAIYVNVDVTNISCIDHTNGAINLTVAGGIQPYSFVWNTGQITEDIDNLDDGTYIVTITDNNSCSRSETVVLLPMDNECVDPVNTFTPNGDDYNDTWVIANLHLYPNARVEVFNKWGNLVHSQQGVYEPWDGKSNGEILPSDVYYYIIDLYNDQENKYTGSITIIR